MTDDTEVEETPGDAGPEALALEAPKRDAGTLYRRLIMEQPGFIAGYLVALVETGQLDSYEAKKLGNILVPKEGSLEPRKALQKDALETLAFFDD